MSSSAEMAALCNASLVHQLRGARGNMLARLSLCCVALAAGASVPGSEKKPTGMGEKVGVPGVGAPGVSGISPVRKDGLKASGAPAPGELQPGELSKMRDTMRRAYCANGANPTTAPCELQGFMTKVRAEKDPEKKKALLEERKKELAANPRDKASYAKDFFGMFDGYCAKGGEPPICTNKQLLAAKAKNQIPSFQSMPAGPTVVGKVKGLPSASDVWKHNV